MIETVLGIKIHFKKQTNYKLLLLSCNVIIREIRGISYLAVH